MLAALTWFARAAVCLARQPRPVRNEVPLPGDGTAVIRYRFLFFSGDEGASRKQAVAVSLRRVFQAVHRARQEVACLLESLAGRGPEPPRVRKRIARWFGGNERRADTGLVQSVFNVLAKVHRGMRAWVFLIECASDETAIASATGHFLLRLGARYWNEARGQRRVAGILYHELTHLFAGTDDKARQAKGRVYLHEPEGTELLFVADPPEYYDSDAPTPGGLYPPPEDLVRLADAHESFLEEYYLE